MIQVNDLTRRSFKVAALDDNETISDLGGYPKHIEGVPASLWNTHGNLDFRVERISDPMYAGGAVVIRNALKQRLYGLGMKRPKPSRQFHLIEEIPFEDDFQKLLEKHGYKSEESADVAAIIAKELGLFKKEKV